MFIDLTGERFGRLLVLERAQGMAGVARWRCKCDCGNETIVRAASLRRKVGTPTRSCGCLHTEVTGAITASHRLTGTVIHIAWCHLLQRCYKTTNKSYHNYGGRGIVVCEFIRASPANLLSLIGGKPSRSHSIDRIDNEGNYSCGQCAECLTKEWSLNVRWATRVQQQRNKRNTLFVTHDSETLTLQEWSERTGINYHTLFSRIDRGKELFAPLQH